MRGDVFVDLGRIKDQGSWVDGNNGMILGGCQMCRYFFAFFAADRMRSTLEMLSFYIVITIRSSDQGDEVVTSARLADEQRCHDYPARAPTPAN